MKCKVKVGDLQKALLALQKQSKFIDGAYFVVKGSVLSIRQNTHYGLIYQNLDVADAQDGMVFVLEPRKILIILSSLSDAKEVELSVWPNDYNPRRLLLTFRDGATSGSYLIALGEPEESIDDDKGIISADLYVEFQNEDEANKVISHSAQFTDRKSYSSNADIFLLPYDESSLMVAAFTGATFCATTVKGTIYSQKTILLPVQACRFKAKAILVREDTENDRNYLYLMNDYGYISQVARRFKNAQEYQEPFKRLFRTVTEGDNNGAEIVQFNTSPAFWSSLTKALNSLIRERKQYRAINQVTINMRTGYVEMTDEFDGTIWSYKDPVAIEGDVTPLIARYGSENLYFGALVIKFILNFLNFVKIPMKAYLMPVGSVPALVLCCDNFVAAAAPLSSEYASRKDSQAERDSTYNAHYSEGGEDDEI